MKLSTSSERPGVSLTRWASSSDNFALLKAASTIETNLRPLGSRVVTVLDGANVFIGSILSFFCARFAPAGCGSFSLRDELSRPVKAEKARLIQQNDLLGHC